MESQQQNQQQQQNENSLTSVEVNGYNIDDRIAEYVKQASILDLKIDQLIEAETKFDELIGYMNLLLVTNGKLAMWNRVKIEYIAKAKATIFGKTVAMAELESLISSVNSIIERLEILTENVANGGIGSYELPVVYEQYRKQKRILAHYENELRVCKTEKQSFELDSILLQD